MDSKDDPVPSQNQGVSDWTQRPRLPTKVSFKGGSHLGNPIPTFFLASPISGMRFLLRVVVCNILIHLKCIYNFWCFMLVFTPFALCFVTLRGVFMRFLELTYWQDATVPVPCFLLFLYFRKATQEKFSELDETSSWSLILPGSFQISEEAKERGHRPASH
jgi:hypothetical protein